MNKTITALALSAILIPAAVLAGNYHGDRGERRADRMAEHLQLNEQQQTQVKQIFAEQRDKRKAMREELRNDTQTRIAAVLTPEQQAEWKQFRDSRKQGMCDRHERGDGHHGRHDDDRHERGEDDDS